MAAFFLVLILYTPLKLVVYTLLVRGARFCFLWKLKKTVKSALLLSDTFTEGKVRPLLNSLKKA